jgi:hypothetical protein
VALGLESFVMLVSPFLWRDSRPAAKSEQIERGMDAPTADDPLPTVVDLEKHGYALIRETRDTRVRQETTDDQ